MLLTLKLTNKGQFSHPGSVTFSLPLDSEAGDEPEGQSEADHWRGPAPALEEKSR